MWQHPNQCLVQGFDKFELGVKILIIQKHQSKHCHLNFTSPQMIKKYINQQLNNPGNIIKT
jgi:hypothetical protein